MKVDGENGWGDGRLECLVGKGRADRFVGRWYTDSTRDADTERLDKVWNFDV